MTKFYHLNFHITESLPKHNVTVFWWHVKKTFFFFFLLKLFFYFRRFFLLIICYSCFRDLKHVLWHQTNGTYFQLYMNTFFSSSSFCQFYIRTIHFKMKITRNEIPTRKIKQKFQYLCSYGCSFVQKCFFA